jgi:hypothetical protein
LKITQTTCSDVINFDEKYEKVFLFEFSMESFLIPQVRELMIDLLIQEAKEKIHHSGKKLYKYKSAFPFNTLSIRRDPPLGRKMHAF